MPLFPICVANDTYLSNFFLSLRFWHFVCHSWIVTDFSKVWIGGSRHGFESHKSWADKAHNFHNFPLSTRRIVSSTRTSQSKFILNWSYVVICQDVFLTWEEKNSRSNKKSSRENLKNDVWAWEHPCKELRNEPPLDMSVWLPKNPFMASLIQTQSRGWP